MIDLLDDYFSSHTVNTLIDLESNDQNNVIIITIMLLMILLITQKIIRIPEIDNLCTQLN